MKKLLTLVLCAALLLSCVGTISFADEAADLRTVTIMCKKDFNTVWHTEGNEDNACWRYFVEQLAARGIQVELEAIDNASICTTIQTRMAAASDLPDVVSSCWDGLSSNEIVKWGNDGLVLDVYELLAQYDDDGSILEFYKTKCPSALGLNTTPDGKLFWFSYLVNSQFVDANNNPVPNYGNIHPLSIRSDWLPKIGAEYKFFYTHDELFDILVKMQEADCNGNGVADEVIGFSANHFYNGVALSFGLGQEMLANLDPETDTYYSNFEAEGFTDYINYMKKLYEAGLYDTTIMGDGMENQMMADNKISLAEGYATWTSWEPTISDPAADYAAFFLDENNGENGYRVIIDPNSTTYNYHFVTKDCKDPEAVVDMFDYIYTDEYAELDMFGIEGLSFNRNEYGIPQTAYNGDMENQRFEGVRLFNSWGLYVMPCINITTQVLDETFDAVPQFPNKDAFRKFWVVDRSMLDKSIQLNANAEFAIATEEEAELADDVTNDLYTYTAEILSDLVLGKKDIENLDEYIAELNGIGLQEYIDVCQARHDRYLAATQG